MNKGEFVRSIAEEYNLDPDPAKELVEMVLDHIKLAVLENHRLLLSDFGTFETKFKKRRNVADNLNVLEGQSTVALARLNVKFRPAKKFKDALIEKGEELRAEMELDGDDDDEEN